MSTFEARQQVLSTLRDELYELLINPPKLRGSDYVVDIGQVSEKLAGLEPFWQAYIQVAKVEKDRYAVRNMQQDERAKYLSCLWWRAMLEATIEQASRNDMQPNPDIEVIVP